MATDRIELNAMATPQFIAWLDEKMVEHGSGKLVPPPDVLEAELTERLSARSALISQLRYCARPILMAGLPTLWPRPRRGKRRRWIRQLFKQEPEREWRDHIEAVVANLKNRPGGKQA